MQPKTSTCRFSVLALACLVAACAGPDQAIIRLPLDAAPGSAQPHMARAPDGTMVLSWLEPDGDAVALRYAILGMAGWQRQGTVATGSDWFVNWADFPSVVPLDDSLWAAHWLAKRPGGTYSYDVVMSISTDGVSWSSPVTPHTDGTRTEHGFVSLFPAPEGVGAVWLDGRNMTEDGHDHESGGTGHMTLRSAVVTPNGAIAAGALVDDMVCDCCQTDVAMGADGPILVYRDRTGDEIRDIYVTRGIDGEWESPRPVADDNWNIPGCPVNGPAIATQGDNVVVAWFTAADDRPRVHFARSTDNAKTFGERLEIDAAGVIGRVDVELLDAGTAIVSWLRKNESKEGELCIRTVTQDGQPGPVHVVAKTAAARSSGFPQMVRNADSLILAWTDTSGEESRVMSGRLDVSALRR